MITKHFNKNKNGKVEFSEKELKELLDEVYNQGVSDGKNSNGYWWSSPITPYYPIYYTTNTNSNGNTTITLNGSLTDTTETTCINNSK